ncbi:MAG: hypothetical protein GXP41_11390 [Chloroflexi bacterium]|nr:hypothetical protein [Chloroflexota bacterium]
MQPISYDLAEQHTLHLARKLQAHLGSDLPDSRFVAIPRGGLIVLGMLSYALGLGREQIESYDHATGDLVVVVDDCSLSGRRFGEVLAYVKAPRVVFAHLLSHPALRRAILESEPRVEACLAAADLREREGSTPANAEAHEATWRERLPGRRYWLGIVEPVAFAWSEPDKVLWNERTQQLEDHWHNASPRQCLDTRVSLNVPLQDNTFGPLDVPAHVHWKVDNGETVLWHAAEDQVYGLEGVAGAMWRALWRSAGGRRIPVEPVRCR